VATSPKEAGDPNSHCLFTLTLPLIRRFACILSVLFLLHLCTVLTFLY